MKSTTLLVASILIALTIAFALVRLDLLDAEILRFLPAVLGAIVAMALAFFALRRKKVESKDGKRRVK